MSSIFADLILQLANLSNKDEQEVFIFQHPVLLRPDIHQGMSERLSSMPAKERRLLTPVLKNLQDLCLKLEENPGSYPIGLGPIERIWVQQQKGEVSDEYAEALARDPSILALLSPLYIRALSDYCVSSTHKGGWRNAIQLQNLVMACVDSLVDSEEKVALQQATGLDWIEIVHFTLCYIPDGRIYRKALAVGERIIQQAKAPGDQELLGKVYHRLGTLHLDPYTYERTNKNYDQDIRDWRQRLYIELGAEIVNVSEDELQMPEPSEALKKAEEYLRQAVDILQGHQKGLSLKALTQTLEWREDALKEKVDRKEIISLCYQALNFIEADADPQQRLAVLATLRRYGQPVEPEEVDKTLKTSLDEYIRRFHTIGTIDLIQHASSILFEKNPIHSLEILREAHSLYKLYGNERQCELLWTNEINLIISGLSPKIPSKLPKGGINAVFEKLHDRAKKEHWDIQKLSAGLISLAGFSYKWNEELAGLTILERAKELAPIFTDSYADAIAYLQANLTLGVAVNSVNSGEWAIAVEYYAQTLRQYVDLNMADKVVDCLDRIHDLASRGGPAVAQEVVLGIASLALLLEKKIGEPAKDRIQRLCKHTVAAISTQAVNPEVLFFLRQVAKGLHFSTTLYFGSHYRWQEDKQGADILSQIGTVEASLPEGRRYTILRNPEALLDEDTILTAYIRPGERQSGDNPVERLYNLQHNYDAYFNSRLSEGVAGGEPVYFTTSDVQATLDDRTVLLDYYLGASANGNIAVYLVAMTREDIKFGIIGHNFPDSLVTMGDGERQVFVSPFAVTVGSLRKELVSQKFIGPRAVSYEAGETLETDLRGYFGYLVEYLDDLNRSGKDHLCIVPHGPLHYYPFHLIGEPEKPLADKWIVTYLPNLGLLVSRRGLPAIPRYRRRQLTAIGLSFEKSELPGLSPIPNSIIEAQEVAKTFDLLPVPEAQATKKALTEALRESRYVHISTHGRHNVAAPAFQCIYLTPDDESDGRLYAYELLSMDLRGLEILTLSACETALGRFDTGDNLRGLPATLFLAGVSTIVGTLWEAEAYASECFFTAFYRALKENKGRLDAFAIAQRETRDAFPKYGSWGPFCLMGDWL